MFQNVKFLAFSFCTYLGRVSLPGRRSAYGCVYPRVRGAALQMKGRTKPRIALIKEVSLHVQSLLPFFKSHAHVFRSLPCRLLHLVPWQYFTRENGTRLRNAIWRRQTLIEAKNARR